MARLLLLVPTTSYRVQDFLAAARRLGVDVAVGSDRRQVLEKYSDGRTVTLSFRDVERGVRQIVDYAERYPLRAIIGVDDPTVVLAARAAAVLGLRHNPPAAVEAVRNKHRFRQAMREAGIPRPEFRRIGIDDDPAEVAQSLDYPVVVKPLALSASRGVIRADDAPGFEAAFRRAAAIVKETRGLDAEAKGGLLVEDYVPGTEVAVEGLLTDGRLDVLALFDKPDPLEGPFFEETLFVAPSRLPEALQARIADAISTAVPAVGLTDGPLHAELRIADGEPVVIEIAPRTIGGLCARTLRFGAGIALEELVLRHALDLPIDTLARESAAAGVMMIPIPAAGILSAVDGEIEARAVPGIKDVVISLPLGEEVVPLPEGDKYLGFIFARAARPEEAEAALREAYARLDIVIT